MSELAPSRDGQVRRSYELHCARLLQRDLILSWQNVFFHTHLKGFSRVCWQRTWLTNSPDEVKFASQTLQLCDLVSVCVSTGFCREACVFKEKMTTMKPETQTRTDNTVLPTYCDTGYCDKLLIVTVFVNHKRSKMAILILYCEDIGYCANWFLWQFSLVPTVSQ